MSCGKYTADYWRDLLEQLAGEFVGDVDKLIAWIAEESGGCPAALGAVFEVGIWQLDLEDGPAFGGTLDSLHGAFCASPSSTTLTRELTADEEQLQVTTGLAFVRHARQVATDNLAANGLSWSSDDDVWALTKLYHALPRLVDQYLAAAAAAGAASSWSDYRTYLLGLSKDDAIAVNSVVGSNPNYFPFGRFVTNAEAVGFAGGSSLVGMFGLRNDWSALVILLAVAAAALALHRSIV